MKTLSLFAVALIASAALLSSGCSEPSTTPAPTSDTPAAESGSGTSEEPAGSSTSSTTEGSAELTAVSFNVEGMT